MQGSFVFFLYVWTVMVGYNLVIKPHIIPMTKLRNVPAKTYSVFAVSVSLNLSKDLAVIINPIPPYCPTRTKIIVRIRSNPPMSAPAFFISFGIAFSSNSNLFNISLIKIFVGFMHSNTASISNEIEYVHDWSNVSMGSLFLW